MNARLLMIPIALLAVVLWSPGSTDATILIKKDLAQLSTESECIVIGQIGTQSCRYARGTGLIFTYTTLHVERVLKGKVNTDLTVAEIGGTVGDITLKVASMPRFKEGERVLLFLKKDALGQQRVHGAIQGRFHLVHNRALDEEQVVFDRGLSHVTRPFFATKHDPAPRYVSLEEFEARIQALLARAKKSAGKGGKK